MIVAAALVMLTQVQATPPDAPAAFVRDPVSWERPPMPMGAHITGEGEVGLDCAVRPNRGLSGCRVIYRTGAPGTVEAVLRSTRDARLAVGTWPERVRFVVNVRISSPRRR